MSSAIVPFPKLGYNAPFAGITEDVDWLLRQLTPAAQAIWRELRRSGIPGIDLEFNLNDLAIKLDYSTRWLRSALRELLELGLLESDRKTWREWFRVRVIDLGILHKTSESWKENGKKQPSNADSVVTYSLKSLKEEQTEKFNLENSPLQKEGLRSPLPKPKPRNQEPEPESELEPELTEALGLIAEYGSRTGDRDLETKSRVRNAIANIARNFSPEKLMERVRNAIAATEQTRLKGALRKPIECLLSKAISCEYTPNVSKPKAATLDDQPFLENGAGRVYCAADWEHLGTFDHQPILPVDDEAHLVNPLTPNSQLPSEKNQEFQEGISVIESECQVIAEPTPCEPTEDELSDAITYSRCYEEKLGISSQDRPSVIQRLIGVSVSGLSKLADSQRVQYYRALVHESTSNIGKNH